MNKQISKPIKDRIVNISRPADTGLILNKEDNVKRIRIYIADKDAYGYPILPAFWIEAAKQLFAHYFGGASVYPSVEGVWKNSETGKIINEHTIVIEALVSQADLIEHFAKVEDLISRYAKTTNQAEVLLEVGTSLFRYKNFIHEIAGPSHLH